MNEINDGGDDIEYYLHTIITLLLLIGYFYYI